MLSLASGSRSSSWRRRLRLSTFVALSTFFVSALGAQLAGGEPPPVPNATASVAGDLVYSVNRTPENPFDTARAVQVISSEEIWRRNARTLPEVLMEEAGIFVQQTNYGGGSPIIRGQIGKEILILIDGVRVNNATYRFGPIQYLSTIDLAAVDRIEVVRGADSVLTGSALGGIINIITRKGPSTNQSTGGSLFLRYASADQGIVGSIEASGRTDRLRYRVGGTFRDSSDLEGGDGIGEQLGTGYEEAAASLNFDFYLDQDRTFSFRYQDLVQRDVPRTDRLFFGNNLVFDFDPQRLQLATVVYSDLTDRKWSESLQATLFWNRQGEDRQEIRTSAPTTERRFEDEQTMFGLNLELSTFLGGSHRLLYGIDASVEDVESTRTDIDLETGAERVRRGRFTNNSSYDTLGIYLQDRFTVSNRFTLTLGARYSRFETGGSEDSVVGVLELDGSEDELTGSLGAVYRLTERTRLVGTLTRAFRGANIDDVSVFDARPDGIEVPNPGLAVETMITVEAGVKHQGPRLSLNAFYYDSKLDNQIERAAGMFQGLPFFDGNGNGIQDEGELPVLQKQNLGEASIEGAELDFRVRASAAWTVFGNYTYTRGEDALTKLPLSRIPPTFGTLGLRWAGTTTRRPWAQLIYQFADSQRRISSRDIADIRIGPAGTDGFSVFHLRGGLDLGSRARVNLAVENLFDEDYKYYASGVFRPGRQLVLGGKFRF